MAVKFDFSLIGLKEVKAKMNKVTKTVLDNGTREALSQGLK